MCAIREPDYKEKEDSEIIDWATATQDEIDFLRMKTDLK